MASDPLAVAEAIDSLRALTRCCCEHPYPLNSGRHDPSCRIDWSDDVEILAAAAFAVEPTPALVTDAARAARVAFHQPGRDPFPSDERWQQVVRAVIAVLDGAEQ